jgi:flagellar basal-body rod modification protein FlgD
MSSIAAFLPHAGTATAPAAAPPVTTPVIKDPLADEQTFLKLLVSQLKNQNPLNPTDGTQFVSQLTSYSQLEQLIGIRQNTTAGPATEPVAIKPPSKGV